MKMLLVCDYEIIFKDDIEVINEFVKKGNIFIITTHLSVFKVQKKLKDLNFSYIICNNGSMVFDKDFNLIYRQDLKKEVLKPIFAFLKKTQYKHISAKRVNSAILFEVFNETFIQT